MPEGAVRAAWILPEDPNITPTQIRELQDRLNTAISDRAYPVKLLVLPPVSRRNGQERPDAA